MFALLSLVVCLVSNPVVCETVIPDYVRDDGSSVTLFECLGYGGQEVANAWLREHHQYTLRRIQCSVSNDPEKLRDQLETPEA